MRPIITARILIKQFVLSLFIVSVLFIIPQYTHALTRLRMEGPASTVALNDQAHLKIHVYSDESELAGPKVGERVTIKIKSGSDLDPTCKMVNDISDTAGYTSAQCSSSKKGSIIVYAQSVDKSDTSNDVELRFDDIPTPPPVTQDQVPQESGGLSSTIPQEAMDAPNVKNPNQLVPGLQDTTQSDSQGQTTAQTVLGENTIKTEGDLSLITSLIFFAAGIILLITVSYVLILLTKKKKLFILSSDHEKKEEAHEAPKP